MWTFERLEQSGNTVLQHHERSKCFLRTKACKLILVTLNKIMKQEISIISVLSSQMEWVKF